MTSKSEGGGVSAYVGEYQNQLRHGFGAYRYRNKFFRYEGEWSEGQKHGHGRLIMTDGSYYEGQFVDGEMNGSGTRKWAHTGNVYNGKFINGELCGYGQMMYADGTEYNGAWDRNVRQGNGVLAYKDGSLYDGEFYNHKQHGQGSLHCSDSEQYEGEWVNGLRQGHGVMKFKNGNIYSGQWHFDMQNGYGSIVAPGGASYEGQWINNTPEFEAYKLIIVAGESIEIERGSCVNLDVECHTAEGEQGADSGRLLKVTAGVKAGSQTRLQRPAQDGTSSEELRISTPFGFDVYPHPITELTPIEDQTDVSVDRGRTPAGQDGQPQETSQDTVPSPHGHTNQTDNSGTFCEMLPETPEDDAKAEAQDDADGQTQDETFLALHGTVVNGKASFKNLCFPHNPLVSTRFSPENIDGRQTAGRWKRENGSTGQTDASEKTMKPDNKGKKEKKDAKGNKPDRYNRPGEYVIIVEDVTDPPFLGAILQPTHVFVKVTSPMKKTKSKTDGRKEI